MVKILDIREFDLKFDIIIEVPNRSDMREIFPFNKGEGWEEEENGIPKWQHEIERILAEREKIKEKIQPLVKPDFKKYIGKKLRPQKIEEPTAPQPKS